jgi:predicted RNase H-like nuclease
MIKTARFFGIDLAWAERNPSAGCSLDARGAVVDERLLGGDDEVTGWIVSQLDGPAVVAVDAPLLVPNQAGRRPCEAELGKVYAGRKAGPHPANRRLLESVNGTIRGERIAAALAGHGFGDPWAGSERTLLEVYPHPTLIEVFDLPERLAYKAKPGLSVPDRRRGLRRLSGLLASLSDAQPPLVAPRIRVRSTDRGAALKAIEDRLDARVCAWVAAVWATSPEIIRLFGDTNTGHIAVPVGRFFDS